MSRPSPALIFSIALGLFLLAVWLAFRQVDMISVFSEVSIQAFATVLLIRLSHFFIFGLQLNTAYREQYGLRLGVSEILLLPLMMHLFIYILPIKGGLLFQIYYMKHRHQLDLSKGFSLGLSIFFASLMLTLIVGMTLVFYLDLVPGPIFYFLLLLAIAFFTVVLVLKLAPSLAGKLDGRAGQLLNFLDDVRSQLVSHMSNLRLLAGLVTIGVLLLVINAVWYQQAAAMLGYESTFPAMLLVTVVLNMILLVRILPGNLGFQELLVGVVFAAAGFGLQEGLLVALVMRFTSVLLAASIGMAGLYSNLKLMHANSVRKLLSEVSEAQSP